jgi:hypothetical protein
VFELIPGGDDHQPGCSWWPVGRASSCRSPS